MLGMIFGTIFSLILIGVAYLLGSIPFGLVLTRYKGLDIRKIGSGNIGATNVLRTGDKKLAAMTLAFDAGKGFIAVELAKLSGYELTIALAGIAAVIGHVFPVWLQFKGGKGVATTLAVFWAAYWPLAVFACMVWLGMFLIFRTSSLAAITAMALSPVFAYFFGGWSIFVLAFLLGGLVIYRHEENIKRLIAGKEIPLHPHEQTAAKPEHDDHHA